MHKGGRAAEKGEQEEGLLPEEEDMPVTEQFEYIKHPVAPFPLSEPEYTSAPREKIREDQKKHPFSLKALFSFLSEDEEEGDSLYAVLPDFIDDDLEPMDPSDYGGSSSLSLSFQNLGSPDRGTDSYQ